jgi:hypothetical protein
MMTWALKLGRLSSLLLLVAMAKVGSKYSLQRMEWRDFHV